MGIISNAAFIRMADRLGSQYKLINVVPTAQIDAGGLRHIDNILYDANSLDTVLTSPLRSTSAIPPSESGYDVSTDLGTPAKTFDTNIIDNTLYIKPFFANLISSLESHLTKKGAPSLNSFLTTSGIQVAQSFADTYNIIKSSKLTGPNVFVERDIQLGTLNVTSSGIGAFASALSMGTGSGSYVTTPDSQINYAPTFVEALVISGVGPNNLLMQLNMQDQNLNNVNVNFTIPANTTSGAVIQITSSGTRYYKMNSSASSFSGGANGDAVLVRGRILRSIGL